MNAFVSIFCFLFINLRSFFFFAGPPGKRGKRGKKGDIGEPGPAVSETPVRVSDTETRTVLIVKLTANG